MLFAYRLAAYALAPAYCGALLWRGLRERGYWQHFGERFGFGAALSGRSVWVHAASVGEVQAAAALIAALRARVGDETLVLTTLTPAGAARARALFTNQRVDVRHLPLDLPGSIRRFLARTRPRLAIVLETELWPTLYAVCARRGIPVALASARISQHSLQRYRRLRALFAPVLRECSLIGAQSAADAERFQLLGADPARTHVTGNLKFDFAIPPATQARGRALRERLAAARPLWVAGSTHEGEEQAVLEAHARVRGAAGNVLLALAPRHPQRFEAVAGFLAQRGVPFVRHSRGEISRDDTQVLLVDSLGELLDFYAAADVAFVGGSLVPVGGHNLLEPAALGRPILTGPCQTNGADIARLLLERGAAQTVRDAGELGVQLAALLADPDTRARMGRAGERAVEENRGALAQLLELLAPFL